MFAFHPFTLHPSTPPPLSLSLSKATRLHQPKASAISRRVFATP